MDGMCQGDGGWSREAPAGSAGRSGKSRMAAFIRAMDGGTKDDPGEKPMDDRWEVSKLALLLYVFAAGPVAINLFMLGLIVQGFGLAALSPAATLAVSVPLCIPAGRLAGRRVHSPLDQAADP